MRSEHAPAFREWELAPTSVGLLLSPGFDSVLAVGRLAQRLARLVYTE